ncbi:TetR/AcrR family transcriptional regulator [Longibaculum muris]|uniref:TetR/AcrR family transcriptional regulator n=1 Tax=Longibaculum muris TaxID=1796628 RepID=UPI0022E3095B|nr:TetR-like C-terminal domain-containing protein [Longibaculum muris]
MANYTQRAIIQTFQDMLKEMPFDKITVSAIVARCDISSNTFYYHYHDIYDLLDTWLHIREIKYFEEKDLNLYWKDALKMIFHDVQDNPDIVNHIFNSISRDRIEKYVFDTLDVIAFHLVQKKDVDKVLSEDNQHMIASACCYMLLGFLIKFIWNGMKDDVDESIEELNEIFEGTIEHIINKEKKKIDK